MAWQKGYNQVNQLWVEDNCFYEKIKRCFTKTVTWCFNVFQLCNYSFERENLAGRFKCHLQIYEEILQLQEKSGSHVNIIVKSWRDIWEGSFQRKSLEWYRSGLV